MKFTEQQLSDWKRYEKARKAGKYNMLDPRARRETGLGPERYSFALRNYSELKHAVEMAQEGEK